MGPRWHPVQKSLVAILVLVFSIPSPFAHTDIPASEAHAMIQTDENVVVLDVREYSEFCGSVQHIEDAANLPWNSSVLQARFDELPTDVNIIVVCSSGGRSNQAATFLDNQGFTNIYDMQGGMNAWSWDKEACGASPVISMHGTTTGTEINWTPANNIQDYDLIRGVLEDIVDAGTFIDLGAADCLCKDSPFTYYNDPEEPSSSYFYLVRRSGGNWGESSDRVPRSPASLSCQGDAR